MFYKGDKEVWRHTITIGLKATAGYSGAHATHAKVFLDKNVANERNIKKKALERKCDKGRWLHHDNRRTQCKR